MRRMLFILLTAMLVSGCGGGSGGNAQRPLTVPPTGGQATSDQLPTVVPPAGVRMTIPTDFPPTDKARLEQLALDKEDLEAGQLVAQCVEHIRVLAEPKGISVRFESKDGTNIRGDPVKLRQLFLNILDNAIKYTPPGGEVEVEVVREGEWVKITVRDTGPGIPEKDMPRIFDRFFRGQGHGREKGFGLGLSIAKAIAEAHGGRIEVSTPDGGGTCFDMFLPIRPPARFSAVSGDPSVPRKY